MPDLADTGAGQGLSGDEVRELYRDLRAQYSGRNGEYMTARDRYRGKHWDAATNPAPLGRYSLTINYIRPTVDKAVQAVIGKLPGIQVFPPGVDEGARRLAENLESIIYATWDLNDAEAVFRRAFHNAVLLRRGFLYYWWDPSIKRVRFRSIAPDNVFPIMDGEDISEAVIVSRRLTRELQRSYPKLKTLIRPDEDTPPHFDDARWMDIIGGVPDTLSGQNGATNERNSISGQTTVLDWYDRHGNWTRVMGDAVHTQDLKYGTNRVPLIEILGNIQSDESESRSDIDDIVELNQYLDQLVSQQADVLRKFANPTVIDYGSGQDPTVVKRTVQNPEGAVLPVRKDAKIEFLNWTGLPPAFHEQYERVLAALYDLSGKPASSFGQTVTNQSGVVTNLALSPIVAQSQDKESIFGMSLVKLNEDILRLYEKFMKGEQIEARGITPSGFGRGQIKYYEVSLKGAEIGGWYKNRIKWPSTLRTDDPTFVQNELQKMQSDPPAQSIYTTLENLGIEDVEAEIDRIKAQLEDPRFHPDRLQGAIDAATALQGTQLPTDLQGLAGAPALEGNLGRAEINTAAQSVGSPDRDQLVSSDY